MGRCEAKAFKWNSHHVVHSANSFENFAQCQNHCEPHKYLSIHWWGLFQESETNTANERDDATERTNVNRQNQMTNFKVFISKVCEKHFSLISCKIEWTLVAINWCALLYVSFTFFLSRFATGFMHDTCRHRFNISKYSFF